MGTFESVRRRQVCGSAEDCNLGTSCSSTAEMSFEARIKLLRAPWDEWNRAFQVLVDQHVQKVEQISTRFDALVKRTEIVADQVAAWGNLQPEPVRPGTTHTAALRNDRFGGLLAVWHRELSKVRTSSEPWCSKADSVDTVSMTFGGSFDFG